MSDRFTQQVRDALHDTAAAAEASVPDLDRVRADADRHRPRDGRVLPLAVAAVALVVLGLVTVQVLDRRSAVVLEDGGSAVAASAEALIGRTFTSTSDLPGAPAPDGVLTVQFTPPQNPEDEGPGQVGIEGRTEPGCNGGSVIAEVDEAGQTHLVTSILSTLMGCPGVPSDMDDWWHDLLEDEPQLLLDGDRLVVRTDAGHIDMVEEAQTESPALEGADLDGTEWRSAVVEGLDLPDDQRIALTFEDGRVGAEVACNSFGGRFELVDGRLVIDEEEFGTEAMECPQPQGSWDAWMSNLLMASPTVLGDDQSLTLTVGQSTVIFDRHIEPTPLPTDPDAPLSSWVPPPDYRYTISGSCAPAARFFGEQEVMVRDGRALL